MEQNKCPYCGPDGTQWNGDSSRICPHCKGTGFMEQNESPKQPECGNLLCPLQMNSHLKSMLDSKGWKADTSGYTIYDGAQPVALIYGNTEQQRTERLNFFASAPDLARENHELKAHIKEARKVIIDLIQVAEEDTMETAQACDNGTHFLGKTLILSTFESQ